MRDSHDRRHRMALAIALTPKLPSTKATAQAPSGVASQAATKVTAANTIKKTPNKAVTMRSVATFAM